MITPHKRWNSFRQYRMNSQQYCSLGNMDGSADNGLILLSVGRGWRWSLNWARQESGYGHGVATQSVQYCQNGNNMQPSTGCQKCAAWQKLPRMAIKGLICYCIENLSHCMPFLATFAPQSVIMLSKNCQKWRRSPQKFCCPIRLQNTQLYLNSI